LGFKYRSYQPVKLIHDEVNKTIVMDMIEGEKECMQKFDALETMAVRMDTDLSLTLCVICDEVALM
jgi:hypothetical protein